MSAKPPISINLETCDIEMIEPDQSTKELRFRLDPLAEAFVIQRAELARTTREFELVIQCVEDDRSTQLIEADSCLHHRFRTMAQMKKTESGLLLRQGRISLSIAVANLIFCYSLNRALAMNGFFSDWNYLQETLPCLGILAFWWPAQIYFFDLRPLHRKSAVLQRLARCTVRIVNGEGCLQMPHWGAA